jgi:hypothetical protein
MLSFTVEQNYSDGSTDARFFQPSVHPTPHWHVGPVCLNRSAWGCSHSNPNKPRYRPPPRALPFSAVLGIRAHVCLPRSLRRLSGHTIGNPCHHAAWFRACAPRLPVLGFPPTPLFRPSAAAADCQPPSHGAQGPYPPQQLPLVHFLCCGEQFPFLSPSCDSLLDYSRAQNWTIFRGIYWWFWACCILILIAAHYHHPVCSNSFSLCYLLCIWAFVVTVVGDSPEGPLKNWGNPA